MPIDPMTGMPMSVEDAAKLMFSQRAADTLAQAATEDQAFHQQLAATRYARAHARQAINLPKEGAIGMTEAGDVIANRAKGTGKGNVWIGGRKADPMESAANISKYGPDPRDFQGMGFNDIANTIDALPTQMENADLDHRANLRHQAEAAEIAKTGQMPVFVPAGAVVAEADIGEAPGRSESRLLPNADISPYQGSITAGRAVPGTAAHPTERMFGHLDDTVAQGGYDALFQGRSAPEAAMALAKQLEARRMRQMGAWDPTFVSGGSI